jgi:hypothetical protein
VSAPIPFFVFTLPGRSMLVHRRRRSSHRKVSLAAALVLVVVLATALIGAAPASAASPDPGWAIDSFAEPTSFSSAHNTECLEALGSEEEEAQSLTSGLSCDGYSVVATNSGSQSTEGPITLSDAVPAGLTVKRVVFFSPALAALLISLHQPATEHLQTSSNLFPVLEQFGLCSKAPIHCTIPSAVAPDEELHLLVFVTVNSGTEGSLVNAVSVSGGAAGRPATTTQTNPVDGSVLFGFSSVSALLAGLDGAFDTQAGSHPYELTMRFDLNNELRLAPQDDARFTSIRDVRDVAVDLPVGTVGSALAAPTCAFAQLASHESCPSDTVIGHLSTAPPGADSVESPIYNMVPEHGVVAEFGFLDGVNGAHVLYVRVVPTPAGYVLRTTSPEIPQIDLTDVVATLYGDPAARQEEIARQEGKQVGGITPVALLTNPSQCSGVPLVTSTHADSWPSPGRVGVDGTPDFSDPNWASATSGSPAVTGCNQLQFSPSLGAQPETTAADSPTGLQFDLRVPQSQPVGALATPPLRDAVVTLPAGMAVNPSAAGWLEACSEGQIGWLGGSLSNFTSAAPACPAASRLGSVELTTPALPGTLVGSVYLASQYENPFGSLLAGYIVVDDPTTGVIVKIPGELKTDASTGQITGAFRENPQLPFSDLKLHFFGGGRGELATPQGCGTFTTTSDLMPWSAPESGPDATPSSNFAMNTGCSQGFAPSFLAGTVTSQAGGFSPFTLSIARDDGEQRLSGVRVIAPPGFSGVLSGVPLCGEPQASRGTCGGQSQIGETSVAVGVGPSPYWVTGGRVYLTGPYNGAPFGLSIVVPAVAGPFNFGEVVVRSSIGVDRRTAQITVVSDPLPQMVNSIEGLHSGIPADIRAVRVTINRPGFTFNPTSCSPTLVSGTLSGVQGASVGVSSRFQAAGCASLKFQPKFTVSTAAKTSKANGASLRVKVVPPHEGPQAATNGSSGSPALIEEANIARVKVELPKALPSRLTTLQKACTAAQFASDPAGCPAASIVGMAIAHTPLLNNPLAGPVYFVSHGGEAFPQLVVVLQGEGITVDLVGDTFISKAGVTSSTFRSVPDVPVGSFELDLPQGKYSALAANGNLCAQKLTMPTEFVAQNGAITRASTPVGVTGCPRAKTAAQLRAQKLAAALKVCHKKHGARRASCEMAARKKFRAIKKTKKGVTMEKESL